MVTAETAFQTLGCPPGLLRLKIFCLLTSPDLAESWWRSLNASIYIQSIRGGATVSTTAWPERTQIYTLVAKGPGFCNKSKI